MQRTITKAVRKLMLKLSTYWVKVDIGKGPFGNGSELQKSLLETVSFYGRIQSGNAGAVFTESHRLVAFFFHASHDD
jgi:hypothetical protein